jgi:hypothetical protein
MSMAAWRPTAAAFCHGTGERTAPGTPSSRLGNSPVPAGVAARSKASPARRHVIAPGSAGAVGIISVPSGPSSSQQHAQNVAGAAQPVPGGCRGAPRPRQRANGAVDQQHVAGSDAEFHQPGADFRRRHRPLAAPDVAGDSAGHAKALPQRPEIVAADVAKRQAAQHRGLFSRLKVSTGQ